MKAQTLVLIISSNFIISVSNLPNNVKLFFKPTSGMCTLFSF